MPMMRRANLNDTTEAVYIKNWKPEHDRGALSYVLRRFWVGYLVVGGLGTFLYVMNLIAAVERGATMQGVVALVTWVVLSLLAGAAVTFFWFKYRDKKYEKMCKEVREYRAAQETVWNQIDEMAEDYARTAPPQKKKKNYEIYTSYPRS